jgi:hypothetical protein
VDFIVSKAPPDMTPEALGEWLKDAAVSKEMSFTFKPSSGGGATGAKTAVLNANPSVNVLRNPSPQQLGAAAADIKAGRVKVEYTT